MSIKAKLAGLEWSIRYWMDDLSDLLFLVWIVLALISIAVVVNLGPIALVGYLGIKTIWLLKAVFAP